MSHFPSDFAKVMVERTKEVRIALSLGLSANVKCDQTIPVVPMMRHCGLIGVVVTLSLSADTVRKNCWRAAFPSTGNGESGGKKTSSSCTRAEKASRLRALIA